MQDRGEWHGGTREEIYEVCRSLALQAALCVAFIYTHPLLFVDLSSPITISVQTSTHFTAPKKKESTLLWDHFTLVVHFGRLECALNKCHGSLHQTFSFSLERAVWSGSGWLYLALPVALEWRVGFSMGATASAARFSSTRSRRLL